MNEKDLSTRRRAYYAESRARRENPAVQLRKREKWLGTLGADLGPVGKARQAALEAQAALFARGWHRNRKGHLVLSYGNLRYDESQNRMVTSSAVVYVARFGTVAGLFFYVSGDRLKGGPYPTEAEAAKECERAVKALPS